MLKRCLTVLTCVALLLCASACQWEWPNVHHTAASTAAPLPPIPEERPYVFLSQVQKEAWRPRLVSLLSTLEIRTVIPEGYGSMAVGLMDLNFDHLPEVFVAYPGGSMGNLYFEIYDLSGEDEPLSFNAGHWPGEEYDVYFCVVEHPEGFAVLHEGSLRDPGVGTFRSIQILPRVIDPADSDLTTQPLFCCSTEGDPYYAYRGEEVTFLEYDTRYGQYSAEYYHISSTRMQLFYWDELSGSTRAELVESMAEALLHSSQNFLDFTAQ